MSRWNRMVSSWVARWRERREQSERARAWREEGLRLWRAQDETAWERWASEPGLMSRWGGAWLLELMDVSPDGRLENWRLSALREALRLGASPQEKNEHGETPLMIAARAGLWEACLELAPKSELAEVDAGGRTALRMLIEKWGGGAKGDQELRVVMELGKGGAIRKTDKKGRGALTELAKTHWLEGLRTGLEEAQSSQRFGEEEAEVIKALAKGSGQDKERSELIERLMEAAPKERRSDIAWEAMLEAGSLEVMKLLGRWGNPLEWRKRSKSKDASMYGSPLANALWTDAPAEWVEWMLSTVSEAEMKRLREPETFLEMARAVGARRLNALMQAKLALRWGEQRMRGRGGRGDGVAAVKGWVRSVEESRDLGAASETRRSEKPVGKKQRRL